MIELIPPTTVKRSFISRLFWATVSGFFRVLIIVFGKREPKPLVDSGPDLQLEMELRRGWEHLFQHNNASVISNRFFKSAFGNALITVQVSDLVFCIERDRGTLYYEVAPQRLPNERSVLSVALEAIVGKPFSCNGETVSSVGEVIAHHLELLEDAFSPTVYPQTKNRINEISAAMQREWTRRWNLRAGRKDKIFNL